MNWPAYNEALKRRGRLTIWFDPSMTWEAAPSGKRGRRQVYSGEADKKTIRWIVFPPNAIQACLTIKVLFGLPLRQTTGFVQSLLELSGLNWAVPDFSTLSRRQKTLAVTIPYRGSAGPLHLLIDSTGIKVEGAGEWNARKHGGPKRRVWRKIHIGIDEQTLEVRAVEITASTVGDAPILPDLLDQIPPGQVIGWSPQTARITRTNVTTPLRPEAQPRSGVHLNRWRSTPTPKRQILEANRRRRARHRPWTNGGQHLAPQ